MTPTPPPTGDSPERYDALAALREKNYRRFALGWLLFTIGTRMQAVAVTWELYERTGDELALGLVGLAQALPVIFLALLGGHTADVRDRKKIVFFSQLVFFAASLALAAISYFHAAPWTVYFCLLVLGCAKSFNSPARGALMPQLVPPAVFHNLVTWNSSFFQVAAIGGPLLAGLLLPFFLEAWPICLMAAAGALVCASMMLGINPRPAARAVEPRSIKTLFAGLAFLRQEQTVLAAISLDLFAVLLGGATALLPVFAKDILHVGPTALGLLTAAPFVGALLISLVLAHRPPFKRAGLALAISVAGFGLGTIAFGLSTNFLLSLVLLAVLGGFDAVSVVIRHVLVQARTPEALRGRVAAVNSVFIESSNELGAFESGLVAVLFSPVISVVSGGIGTLLVVGWIWTRFPQLRNLGHLGLHEEEVTSGGGHAAAQSEQITTIDIEGIDKSSSQSTGY